jgi:hypothetical protein
MLVLTLYSPGGQVIQTITSEGFSTEEKCKTAGKEAMTAVSNQRNDIWAMRPECVKIDK